MFAKPYKLKSNNTLKNSEKKHLVQRIQDAFRPMSEDTAKQLVPIKASVSCMKVTLHCGDTAGVYIVDGQPILLEAGERLLPTMCALWKVPALVPELIIHSQVLSKLQGGAPLYLPGVAVPTAGVGFPQFRLGAVVALKTQDNAAACAVGFALLASVDMLMRNVGVCFEMVHIIGDQLCKDPKFVKIERPKMGPASYVNGELSEELNLCSITQTPVKDEWPSLDGHTPKPVVFHDAVTPVDVKSEPSPDAESIEEEIAGQESNIPAIPEDMDGLLRLCLLSFIKREGKSVELPLKTNLLYRNHMVPLCPPDRTLDVKKSSYKKMGKFLDAMQSEGLLEVRELEKGVDAVMAICPSHPAIRGLVPLAPTSSTSAPSTGVPGVLEDYVPPVVREMYSVTAAVQDLFAPLKKGTTLTPTEVRNTVTEYVKSRQLQSKEQKGVVVVDAILAKITGKTEQCLIKWDELSSAVTGRMTPSTEMRFADGTVNTTKSKLDPITLQVVNRSGNKKVTLVSNLEQFGFSLPGLSRACQNGAAAACGVTRAPGARRDQLMLQGDQTYFIAKLLIEKYGLPKKFVEGADKALKKKK